FFFNLMATTDSYTLSLHDALPILAQTIADEGRVDILVNNAGIQYVAPITEFPEAKWQQIIDIMLTAPFLLTKAVLPGMYARNWGDRKSTRLNSSHVAISYAVFCLK